MNFRTLDLNLLRVFDALDTLGSVTGAGEALGLSQPAVSAALGRLRAHLGDDLFVRVGNRMVATPRATALAPRIAAALAALETALSSAERFDPGRASDTFTLRGADYFSVRLMPSLAARLMDEAPGIAIRFLDSGRGELLEMLESGEIDVALEQPTDVPGWVSQDLLFPSPFKIVGAPATPGIGALAPGSAIPMELFCALPHVIRSTDGSMSGFADMALAAEGRTRRVVLALPHFDAVLLAVAEGPFIAAVPAQLADEATARLGLRVLDPPMEFPVPRMMLYWHRRNDNAPAQAWLRERILAAVRQRWGGAGAVAV